MNTREVLAFYWFILRDFVWVFLFWAVVWLVMYLAIGGR